MNQITIRHICRYLMMLPVLAMALVLSACGSESEPSDPTADQTTNYFVNIRISTGFLPTTRSNLPEEEGTPIESKIDLSDLKVLVFDENGVLKDIWYRDGNPVGKVNFNQVGAVDYVLSSWLETSRYDRSAPLSVVVMANWGAHEESSPLELLVGRTKYEELAEKAYRLNTGNSGEAWYPKDESLIPMFGVLHTSLSGYSSQIYNAGNPMNIGTVNLLRSVAKIEIIDLASNETVSITSISLNTRNTRGLLTHDIFDDQNTQQVTSANIPTDPMSSKSLLRFRKKGSVYEVYVPEMALGATLDERACIDVDIYFKGKEETRKIMLAPYNQDGKPTLPTGYMPEWRALLRNHIYRYTISTIPVDTKLDLTVDVQPFSNVSLLPQFGLERTEDGYIVVRDREGNIIKYIRPNGSELTFKADNRWPYLGTFMGVFDSTKRVLIGYFSDGRSIIFNYTSDNFNDDNIYEHLESWEIYSKPTLKYANGKTIPEHLEETFCFRDYENEGTSGGFIKKAYTHTMLDDKGRVIKEDLYPSLEDFWKHKLEEHHDVCGRIKLADFTGERYGDKVVKYYDESGNVTCTLTVTGDTEKYE